MKPYNYRHNLFILTLLISSLIFSMELTFEVDNTPENRAIAQTSLVLNAAFKNCPNDDDGPTLLLNIKNSETWGYMTLLYKSTVDQELNQKPKKAILDKLQKEDKNKLIHLANEFDALDINHNNIELSPICCKALAQKLDIEKDKNVIPLIKPAIYTKLAVPLMQEIFKYSDKAMMPSHSYISLLGPNKSFGPLGKVVIGKNENSGIIHNLKTRKTVLTLEGHTDNISCVAINSDETMGFTGSRDQTIKVWDVSSGRCLHTLAYQSLTLAMACNNATTQLVCGYENGVVKLWDIVKGTCVHTFGPSAKEIRSVAFNKTGTQIIATDYFDAKIYCTTTGALLKTFNHHNQVTSVAFNADGSKAVTGSLNYVFLWDLTTDKCIYTFNIQPPSWEGCDFWICSVELTDDEKRLYTIADNMHQRRIWDAKTGKHLGCIGTSSYRGDGCLLIPTDDYVYNQLKRYLSSAPTNEEKVQFKTTSQESITLIRALVLSHIYRNYTKQNDVYFIKPNSDIDVMNKAIRASEYYQTLTFLRENLCIKYPEKRNVFSLFFKTLERIILFFDRLERTDRIIVLITVLSTSYSFYQIAKLMYPLCMRFCNHILHSVQS